MGDLVEFLKARLAEDERAAQDGGDCRIAWLTYRDAEGEMLYTTVAAADFDDVWCAAGNELPAPASVRVVYETARVLADVEAKRRILDNHEVMHGGYSHYDSVDPCSMLRALVLPYADHPDYRKEWRP